MNQQSILKIKAPTFSSIVALVIKSRVSIFIVGMGFACGYAMLSAAAPTMSGSNGSEQSASFKSALPSQLSRTEFVEMFGDIYEHSAWVAERCYDMATISDLNNKYAVFKCMSKAVTHADDGAQLALIKNHPELGVVRSSLGELTEASITEQLGSGLSDLSPSALDEMHRLNASYRDKFGFPFVMAISGKLPEEILVVLRIRLNHTRSQELKIAISEINKIAFIRIFRL